MDNYLKVKKKKKFYLNNFQGKFKYLYQILIFSYFHIFLNYIIFNNLIYLPLII